MSETREIVSVITCDLEGRIETFNPNAEKLFGYTAEEVVGKNLTKAQKKKLTPGKITRALTETVPKRTVFEQVLEGNTNVKQLAKESGLSQKEVQKAARNIVLGIYQAKKNIGLKLKIFAKKLYLFIFNQIIINPLSHPINLTLIKI